MVSFCFFFSSRRRHTRSLCDWSSDVCSSDLHRLRSPAHLDQSLQRWNEVYGAGDESLAIDGKTMCNALDEQRSEERRVGKESRSRWAPHHEKKKRRLAAHSEERQGSEGAATE